MNISQLDESRMKKRGEDRIWKSITSQSGGSKTVSQTQLGQQFIFDDAIRLTPIIRDWIETKSSKTDRKDLQSFFKDDDILLKIITETFFLLASTTYAIKVTRNKIHTRHKSIVLIQSKLMPTLTFDMVWRFIEVVVDNSSFFIVDKSFVSVNNSLTTSLRYTCTLSENIIERLSLDAFKAFYPSPMLTPPKDWSFKDGNLIGGYETYQYDLIRTRSFDVDYNLYSNNIFKTVNYIQSVPWCVNKEVLDAVSSDLKMPLKEDFVLSPYPEDTQCEWTLDLKEEDVINSLSQDDIDKIKEARLSYSEKREIYTAEVKDFESAMGKYRAIKLAIGVAEEYKNEKEIYFPHSYDFRGRIYPIPIGLSPQGSDAVKAILEYSRGEILTELGEQWAWAYLASLYGDDKIDFKERIDRGKELLSADYRDADEPYQFLAHQLELKKFMKDRNYLFKGRVHLDACNSGLN